MLAPGPFGPKSAWDLVQLRAWTESMEKMPRRGEGPIWHHTAERQARRQGHVYKRVIVNLNT
jgi:hypothetical protein